MFNLKIEGTTAEDLQQQVFDERLQTKRSWFLEFKTTRFSNVSNFSVYISIADTVHVSKVQIKLLHPTSTRDRSQMRHDCSVRSRRSRCKRHQQQTTHVLSESSCTISSVQFKSTSKSTCCCYCCR